MNLTLYGDPRTKKNSARILKSRSGGRFVAPSKAYVDYETDCLRQIKRPRSPISARVNVRCVYYMKTARRVDLANLIEATTDILVKARVLEDDNSKIVVAHDGSRVELDRENPGWKLRLKKWRKKNEQNFSCHRRNALLRRRIRHHDLSFGRPNRTVHRNLG